MRKERNREGSGEGNESKGGWPFYRSSVSLPIPSNLRGGRGIDRESGESKREDGTGFWLWVKGFNWV